ncbi:HAD family hydrolase [Sporolactobacillus terrae]|uniref:HAD family hydrolase n=1 Tax=Sporolactobacillus terrae TaxID=269673 RepID=UPI001CC0BE47|nr:HAD family hydrolase [Sporolactobacillus terrae]
MKLIATDMDSTLLTSTSELPPDFERYVLKLRELGVDFAIASGRPLYTLSDIFSNLKEDMVFICDNGGLVSYKGKILFNSLIDVSAYQKMIRFVEDETDGVAILCGLDSAYISKKNEQYKSFLYTYYTKITVVEDMRKLAVKADKFTIYFPGAGSKAHYDRIFKPQFVKEFSVVISGTLWIDIMNKGIDKGKAMKRLGDYMHIDSSQMMAFGDTYNDAEMLQSVKYSYIVANASEGMKQYANYITASNDDYGVIKIVEELIRRKERRA